MSIAIQGHKTANLAVGQLAQDISLLSWAPHNFLVVKDIVSEQLMRVRNGTNRTQSCRCVFVVQPPCVLSEGQPRSHVVQETCKIILQ